MPFLPSFDKPPRFYTEERAERRVGVEIELGGLQLDDIAQAVKSVFGGEHDPESSFVHQVRNTRFGDFTIEIDTSFLKEKRYEGLLKQVGIDLSDTKSDFIEQSLVTAFSTIVPFEVSTPPIPVSKLWYLDLLREELRRRGGQGTKASLLYAFGLHLNVEAASMSLDYLTNVLKAFVLLYPWVKEQVAVDLTRRMSPYIAAFPEEYVRLVSEPSYSAATADVIGDYLRHNPTRNRPLDMLPLFAVLDQERVMNSIDHASLTKARKAFHYRMPNCLVNDPTWCVAREWSTWVAIEKLAEDPERMKNRAVSPDALVSDVAVREEAAETQR